MSLTLDQEITASTISTVERFNEAFSRHDVDAIMDLMTVNCVFDNTSPGPDGTRYMGQEAVRAFWEQMFRSSPDAASGA